MKKNIKNASHTACHCCLLLFLSLRELQRLNTRIRVNREQVHGLEMRLKEIRKGKGGMVRIGLVGLHFLTDPFFAGAG